MRWYQKALDNPKTTWSGLGAIVAALGLVFGFLTVEQGVVVGFAASGIGHILSGDAVPTPPNLPKK